ncbi:MAG: hypothetical protein OXB84_01135 [Halobacteriovoraceae bacterium]|nr:hypothetical protein [Halobacteriovoraceae bacterium]
MIEDLECFPSESKLDSKADVLRVKKYSKLEFKSIGSIKKPPADLFNLTTDDKNEGRRRSKQPLLSAWKSTIDKKILFNNTNITEEHLPAVYKLNVGDIHNISVEERMIPIEVHEDPKENIPSGQLHAGIQGLYNQSRSKQKKRMYKFLKEELVRISILKY